MRRAAHPVAWSALALTVVLAATLVVGRFAPYDVADPIGVPWSETPGAWLGTDALGRDVWSRTLAGGATLLWASLPIGFATTALGTLLGLLATRLPRLGRALGAVTATSLAVPGGVVVLCAAAMLPPTAAVALAMLALGVPVSARIVRAAAAPLVHAEFLQAAERRGEPAFSVVVGELLPALSGTVVADVSVRALSALQLTAALHVLGFGPPPPAPDWATMIRENLPGVVLAPWSVAAPAGALMAVGLAISTCLDALSHALTPLPTARRGRIAARRGRHAEHGWGGDARPDADVRDDAAQEAVLWVRGLRIGQRRTPLLNVPELRVGPGQALGIQGGSGVGKSTLVAALVGVSRPGLDVVAADHRLAGVAVPRSAAARRRLRRRMVGWSEQDPSRTLDRRRRVADVVADGRRGCRCAADLLDDLGLPPDTAQLPAATLSGGQAARVSLARALAGQPRLLVLDEPTAGLDAASVAAVTTAINGHLRSGGAALVVSHDGAWLHEIATSVMEVRDGAVHPVDHPQPPVIADRRPRSTGEALLQCRGLTVAVHGRASTPPCDELAVSEGEIVALVAPSGAGKSSILRTLAGDRLPSAVRVRGEGLPPVGGVDPRGVQVMVQGSVAALNPGRTLLAQVARQAHIVCGIPHVQARARALETLASLGVSPEVAARRPGSCSGGERQRAALARALVVRAPLLLLDEPTSALDSTTRHLVLDVLAERAHEGCGILVATHEEDVARAADRVVTLPTTGSAGAHPVLSLRG